MRRDLGVLVWSVATLCGLALTVVFARTASMGQATWAVLVATAFAAAWICGAEGGRRLP